MKEILITGAGDGVGKAIAKMLKSENLILVDIEKENVGRLAKDIKQKSFCCDVSNVKDIALLKNILKKILKALIA